MAIGHHSGKPLGSRLDPDVAQGPALPNYLSEQARRQVRDAVRTTPETKAVLVRPRLWVDLLSSQPLCFNLFGPLAEDLPLATRVLGMIWPQIHSVTAIRFEWSPGRDDLDYTGNRSAFDVFVEYEGTRGRCFLGIEIKYHESLKGSAANNKNGAYVEIARPLGIFRDGAFADLQKLPLQQIWLDHLLALRLARNPKGDGWDAGTFVLVHPADNTACAQAVTRYKECLVSGDTFEARTLDDIVRAARLVDPESWADDVYSRYLDPEPVNAVLKRS